MLIAGYGRAEYAYNRVRRNLLSEKPQYFDENAVLRLRIGFTDYIGKLGNWDNIACVQGEQSVCRGDR